MPETGRGLSRWADAEFTYSVALEEGGSGLLLRAARAHRPDGRSMTVVLRTFARTDRPLLERILGQQGRARTILAERILRCEAVQLDQMVDRAG